MTDFPPPGEQEGSGESVHRLPDGTLESYLDRHHRPPGFQGSDGHPYTVSPEVEKTPNLLAPFSGFLVFPRWADNGMGIIGHLETPILLEGRSREEVDEALGHLTLREVHRLLEEAIQDRTHDRTRESD